MEYSAEWLRGAVAALEKVNLVNRDELLDDYRCQLAAAEACDDNPTIDEHINAAVNDLYRKYGPRLDLFFADVEAYKPATLEAKNER